jgi:uncharacterized protein (DUF2249 family)
MPSPVPVVLDVRMVRPGRLSAVVGAAVERLDRGERVVVVCDKAAVATCRSVATESDQTAWDVLDTHAGTTYARITRMG